MLNNHIRRISIIALAVIVFVGGGWYLLRTNNAAPIVHEQAPCTSLTMLSHNAASINNSNPLEFTTILQNLVQAKDPALSNAASMLLAIDAKINPSLPISTIINNAALHRICDSCTEATKRGTLGKLKQEGEIKTTKDQLLATELIVENLESLVADFIADNNKERTPARQFFSAKKFGNTVDKPMRQCGATRFSPLFYNQEMMTYMGEVKVFNEATFCTKWLASVAPHMPSLSAGYQDIRPFLEGLLCTYLFDRYLIETIIQHPGGAKAWVIVAQYLQNSPLGDSQKKDQQLATAYQEHNPSIICLQETRKEFVDLLCEDEYMLSLEDRRCLQQQDGTVGSVILYRKDLFVNAPIQRISLTKEEVVASSIPHCHQDIPLGDELSMNLIQGESSWYFVVSVHADSKGEATPSLLRLIFDKHRALEAQHGRSIHLVVAMDSNTTAKGSKNKCAIATVENILETEGHCIVTYPEAETTCKERSNMQVQVPKAHVLSSEQSDIIIVSKDVVVEKPFMSEHGLSPTNPSDHKYLGATITPINQAHTEECQLD